MNSPMISQAHSAGNATFGGERGKNGHTYLETGEPGHALLELLLCRWTEIAGAARKLAQISRNSGQSILESTRGLWSTGFETPIPATGRAWRTVGESASTNADPMRFPYGYPISRELLPQALPEFFYPPDASVTFTRASSSAANASR